MIIYRVLAAFGAWCAPWEAKSE